eukprot:COSAG01_NODE_47081_length_394_cov_0.257627_1_plen_49_part_10
MRIRHRLGEHDHDRITADVGASPADLALRIDFFKQKTAYEILRSDWSSD